MVGELIRSKRDTDPREEGMKDLEAKCSWGGAGTPERRYEGLGWACWVGELSQQPLTAQRQGNRLCETGLKSGGRGAPQFKC